MKTSTKVVLGVAGALTAGAAGYFVYKGYKEESTKMEASADSFEKALQAKLAGTSNKERIDLNAMEYDEMFDTILSIPRDVLVGLETTDQMNAYLNS